MNVRRGPVIVLSSVLSAAALAFAPVAIASDDGTAKDVDPCSQGAKVKLRVSTLEGGRLETVGSVWTDDENVWNWKFKHNDGVSFSGDVKANGTPDGTKSFRIERTMIPDPPDWIVFRAENTKTGEVCKAELSY